ncbi:unnamed protein product [Amoebophrya sp. A25]|nr:unnamed protein product [Amoebophrya sp. A25]|eukprot:GSA25T00026178001.1
MLSLGGGTAASVAASSSFSWVNLTQFGSAFQSSTNRSATASRATDGNAHNGDDIDFLVQQYYQTNGVTNISDADYASLSLTVLQSCSETETQTDPVWKVSLAMPFNVSSVRITNRNDSSRSDLNDFELYVDGVQCAGTGSGTYDADASLSSSEISRTCNLVGTELKVQVTGAGKRMSLCEVEVYGAPFVLHPSEYVASDQVVSSAVGFVDYDPDAATIGGPFNLTASARTCPRNETGNVHVISGALGASLCCDATMGLLYCDKVEAIPSQVQSATQYGLYEVSGDCLDINAGSYTCTTKNAILQDLAHDTVFEGTSGGPSGENIIPSNVHNFATSDQNFLAVYAKSDADLAGTTLGQFAETQKPIGYVRVRNEDNVVHSATFSGDYDPDVGQVAGNFSFSAPGRADGVRVGYFVYLVDDNHDTATSGKTSYVVDADVDFKLTEQWPGVFFDTSTGRYKQDSSSSATNLAADGGSAGTSSLISGGSAAAYADEYPQNLTDAAAYSSATSFSRNPWFVGAYFADGSSSGGAADVNISFSFRFSDNTALPSTTFASSAGRAARKLRVIAVTDYARQASLTSSPALATVEDAFVSLAVNFTDYDVDADEIAGPLGLAAAPASCPRSSSNFVGGVSNVPRNTSGGAPLQKCCGDASSGLGACAARVTPAESMFPSDAEVMHSLYIVSEDCIRDYGNPSYICTIKIPLLAAQDIELLSGTDRAAAASMAGIEAKMIEIAKNTAFPAGEVYVAAYSSVFSGTSDQPYAETVYPSGWTSLLNFNGGAFDVGAFVDFDADVDQIGGNITFSALSHTDSGAEVEYLLYLVDGIAENQDLDQYPRSLTEVTAANGYNGSFAAQNPWYIGKATASANAGGSTTADLVSADGCVLKTTSSSAGQAHSSATATSSAGSSNTGAIEASARCLNSRLGDPNTKHAVTNFVFTVPDNTFAGSITKNVDADLAVLETLHPSLNTSDDSYISIRNTGASVRFLRILASIGTAPGGGGSSFAGDTQKSSGTSADFVPIVDRFASLDLHFLDLDLFSQSVGGFLEWKESSGTCPRKDNQLLFPSISSGALPNAPSGGAAYLDASGNAIGNGINTNLAAGTGVSAEGSAPLEVCCGSGTSAPTSLCRKHSNLLNDTEPSGLTTDPKQGNYYTSDFYYKIYSVSEDCVSNGFYPRSLQSQNGISKFDYYATMAGRPLQGYRHTNTGAALPGTYYYSAATNLYTFGAKDVSAVGAVNAAYTKVDVSTGVSEGVAVFVDRTSGEYSFASDLGSFDMSGSSSVSGSKLNPGTVFVRAFADDKSISKNSLRATLAAGKYGQTAGVRVYLQFPLFYSLGTVSFTSSPGAGRQASGASERYKLQRNCPWLASEGWTLDANIVGPSISQNNGTIIKTGGAVFTKVFPADQTIQLKACASSTNDLRSPYLIFVEPLDVGEYRQVLDGTSETDYNAGLSASQRLAAPARTANPSTMHGSEDFYAHYRSGGTGTHNFGLIQPSANVSSTLTPTGETRLGSVYDSGSSTYVDVGVALQFVERSAYFIDDASGTSGANAATNALVSISDVQYSCGTKNHLSERTGLDGLVLTDDAYFVLPIKTELKSFLQAEAQTRKTNLAVYAFSKLGSATSVTSSGSGSSESVYSETQLPVGFIKPGDETGGVDTTQSHFMDYDLDPLEVGGNISLTITKAPSFSVTYAVFLAESQEAAALSSIGNASGANASTSDASAGISYVAELTPNITELQRQTEVCTTNYTNDTSLNNGSGGLVPVTTCAQSGAKRHLTIGVPKDTTILTEGSYDPGSRLQNAKIRALLSGQANYTVADYRPDLPHSRRATYLEQPQATSTAADSQVLPAELAAVLDPASTLNTPANVTSAATGIPNEETGSLVYKKSHLINKVVGIDIRISGSATKETYDASTAVGQYDSATGAAKTTDPEYVTKNALDLQWFSGDRQTFAFHDLDLTANVTNFVDLDMDKQQIGGVVQYYVQVGNVEVPSSSTGVGNRTAALTSLLNEYETKTQYPVVDRFNFYLATLVPGRDGNATSNATSTSPSASASAYPDCFYDTGTICEQAYSKESIVLGEMGYTVSQPQHWAIDQMHGPAGIARPMEALEKTFLFSVYPTTTPASTSSATTLDESHLGFKEELISSKTVVPVNMTTTSGSTWTPASMTAQEKADFYSGFDKTAYQKFVRQSFEKNVLDGEASIAGYDGDASSSRKTIYSQFVQKHLIPKSTPISSKKDNKAAPTHVLLLAENVLGEQNFLYAIEVRKFHRLFFDNHAVIRAKSFEDLDLDQREVGGQLHYDVEAFYRNVSSLTFEQGIGGVDQHLKKVKVDMSVWATKAVNHKERYFLESDALVAASSGGASTTNLSTNTSNITAAGNTTTTTTAPPVPVAFEFPAFDPKDAGLLGKTKALFEVPLTRIDNYTAWLANSDSAFLSTYTSFLEEPTSTTGTASKIMGAASAIDSYNTSLLSTSHTEQLRAHRPHEHNLTLPSNVDIFAGSAGDESSNAYLSAITRSPLDLNYGYFQFGATVCLDDSLETISGVSNNQNSTANADSLACEAEWDQDEPYYMSLSDRDASPISARFVDHDLDKTQIAGFLTWNVSLDAIRYTQKYEVWRYYDEGNLELEESSTTSPSSRDLLGVVYVNLTDVWNHERDEVRGEAITQPLQSLQLLQTMPGLTYKPIADEELANAFYGTWNGIDYPGPFFPNVSCSNLAGDALKVDLFGRQHHSYAKYGHSQADAAAALDAKVSFPTIQALQGNCSGTYAVLDPGFAIYNAPVGTQILSGGSESATSSSSSGSSASSSSGSFISSIVRNSEIAGGLTSYNQHLSVAAEGAIVRASIAKESAWLEWEITGCAATGGYSVRFQHYVESTAPFKAQLLVNGFLVDDNVEFAAGDLNNGDSKGSYTFAGSSFITIPESAMNLDTNRIRLRANRTDFASSSLLVSSHALHVTAMEVKFGDVSTATTASGQASPSSEDPSFFFRTYCPAGQVAYPVVALALKIPENTYFSGNERWEISAGNWFQDRQTRSPGLLHSAEQVPSSVVNETLFDLQAKTVYEGDFVSGKPKPQHPSSANHGGTVESWNAAVTSSSTSGQNHLSRYYRKTTESTGTTQVEKGKNLAIAGGIASDYASLISGSSFVYSRGTGSKLDPTAGGTLLRDNYVRFTDFFFVDTDPDFNEVGGFLNWGRATDSFSESLVSELLIYTSNSTTGRNVRTIRQDWVDNAGNQLIAPVKQARTEAAGEGWNRDPGSRSPLEKTHPQTLYSTVVFEDKRLHEFALMSGSDSGDNTYWPRDSLVNSQHDAHNYTFFYSPQSLSPNARKVLLTDLQGLPPLLQAPGSLPPGLFTVPTDDERYMLEGYAVTVLTTVANSTTPTRSAAIDARSRATAVEVSGSLPGEKIYPPPQGSWHGSDGSYQNFITGVAALYPNWTASNPLGQAFYSSRPAAEDFGNTLSSSPISQDYLYNALHAYTAEEQAFSGFKRLFRYVDPATGAEGNGTVISLDRTGYSGGHVNLLMAARPTNTTAASEQSATLSHATPFPSFPVKLFVPQGTTLVRDRIDRSNFLQPMSSVYEYEEHDYNNPSLKESGTGSTAASGAYNVGSDHLAAEVIDSTIRKGAHIPLSSFQCPSLVNFYAGPGSVSRRNERVSYGGASVAYESGGKRENAIPTAFTQNHFNFMDSRARNFYNPFLSLKSNEEDFLARDKFFLIHAKSKFFHQTQPAQFLALSEVLAHFSDSDVRTNQIGGTLRHSQPVVTYQKLIEDEYPQADYTIANPSVQSPQRASGGPHYKVNHDATQSETTLFTFNRDECESTALTRQDVNCRLRQVLNAELQRREGLTNRANPLIQGYVVYSMAASNFANDLGGWMAGAGEGFQKRASTVSEEQADRTTRYGSGFGDVLFRHEHSYVPAQGVGSYADLMGSSSEDLQTQTIAATRLKAQNSGFGGPSGAQLVESTSAVDAQAILQPGTADLINRTEFIKAGKHAVSSSVASYSYIVNTSLPMDVSENAPGKFITAYLLEPVTAVGVASSSTTPASGNNRNSAASSSSTTSSSSTRSSDQHGPNGLLTNDYLSSVPDPTSGVEDLFWESEALRFTTAVEIEPGTPFAGNDTLVVFPIRERSTEEVAELRLLNKDLDALIVRYQNISSTSSSGTTSTGVSLPTAASSWLTNNDGTQAFTRHEKQMLMEAFYAKQMGFAVRVPDFDGAVASDLELSMHFEDMDLDLSEIAGLVKVPKPTASAGVGLYLAQKSDGVASDASADLKQIAVNAGATSQDLQSSLNFAIPEDTSISLSGNFSFLVTYALSSLSAAPSGTPWRSIFINDRHVALEDVSFADTDLNPGYMDGLVQFRLLKSNMTDFIEGLTNTGGQGSASSYRKPGSTEQPGVYFIQKAAGNNVPGLSPTSSLASPFAVEAVPFASEATSRQPVESLAAYFPGRTSTAGTTSALDLAQPITRYFAPDGEMRSSASLHNLDGLLYTKNYLPRHSDVLFVDKILLQGAADSSGTSTRNLAMVDSGRTQLDLATVRDLRTGLDQTVEELPVLASYNPYGHSLNGILDSSKAVSGNSNNAGSATSAAATNTPFLSNLLISALTAKPGADNTQQDPSKDFYRTKVRILEINDVDYSIQNLQFLDEDYQTGYIKGKLTWDLLRLGGAFEDSLSSSSSSSDSTQEEEDSHLRYDVFLGDFNANSVQRYIGSAYNGTTEFEFEYHTYLTAPKATVVTVKIASNTINAARKTSKTSTTAGVSASSSQSKVFRGRGASSFASQRTHGLSVSIFDATSSVTNLVFNDLNPNYGYISGLLQWSNPLLRADAIPHVKVQIYQAEDPFGEVRSNLVAELDYTSAAEGSYYVGLDSLSVQQVLRNVSTADAALAAGASTSAQSVQPGTCSTSACIKEFSLSQASFQGYNFSASYDTQTGTRLAGRIPRYSNIALNPDVAWSRRHALHKSTHAIVEDIDSQGMLDTGSKRDGLAPTLFDPRVSLLHQKYFLVRVKDGRNPPTGTASSSSATYTVTPFRTDGFSSLEVGDVVKNLVPDLAFDDFDLRKGWIAGDVRFTFQSLHPGAFDPEDFLYLHLSESASLHYLDPLLEPEQTAGGYLGSDQLVNEGLLSTFGEEDAQRDQHYAIPKDRDAIENYDLLTEQSVHNYELLTNTNDGKGPRISATSQNTVLNTDALPAAFEGHRHGYKKPRLMSLSDLIGEVRKAPVQISPLKIPSWAKYLIVSHNRQRRAWSAIPLIDVHLELDSEKLNTELWALASHEAATEKKLADLENAGLPGIRDAYFRHVTQKSIQSHALAGKLFFPSSSFTEATRARVTGAGSADVQAKYPMVEGEQGSGAARTAAGAPLSSSLARPTVKHGDKWGMKTSTEAQAEQEKIGVYSPNLLSFDRARELREQHAFSFLSLKDRDCNAGALDLVVTMQNFEFLSEKLERLYFVVEEPEISRLERDKILSRTRSKSTTSSEQSSSTTGSTSSSSEQQHQQGSTELALSCRASSARACGDAVRSRYQETTDAHGKRVIRSNGIPLHLYGQNANAHNAICEQPREFKFPMKPERFAGRFEKASGGAIGVLRTGAYLYNPFADEKASRVALHPTNELSMMDGCAGHADEHCVYHHHYVFPTSVRRECSFDCGKTVSTATASASSERRKLTTDSSASSGETKKTTKKTSCTQVGWMLDGFPLYSGCGQAFRSCYFLRSAFSNFDFNAHDNIHGNMRDTILNSDLSAGAKLDASGLHAYVNNSNLLSPDASMTNGTGATGVDEDSIRGNAASDYVYRGRITFPYTGGQTAEAVLMRAPDNTVLSSDNTKINVMPCELDEANGFDFTNLNYTDANGREITGYGYLLTEEYPFVPPYFAGEPQTQFLAHLPHSRSIPANLPQGCHSNAATANPFRDTGGYHVSDSQMTVETETVTVERRSYSESGVGGAGKPEDREGTAKSSPNAFDETTRKRKQILVKKLKRRDLKVVEKNSLFFTAEVELSLPNWSPEYADLVLYATNQRMLAGGGKLALSRKRIRECDASFTLQKLDFVDMDPDLHEVGGMLKFQYPDPDSGALKGWLKTYADLLRAEDAARDRENGLTTNSKKTSASTPSSLSLPLFAAQQSSKPITNPQSFFGPGSPQAGEYELALGGRAGPHQQDFQDYRSSAQTVGLDSLLQRTTESGNVADRTARTLTKQYEAEGATWSSVAKALKIRVLFSKVENEEHGSREHLLKIQVQRTRPTRTQNAGYKVETSQELEPIPRFNTSDENEFLTSAEQQTALGTLIKPIAHDESVFDTQEYPMVEKLKIERTTIEPGTTSSTSDNENDGAQNALDAHGQLVAASVTQNNVVNSFADAVVLEYPFEGLPVDTGAFVSINIPPNTPVVYGGRSLLVQVVHAPRNLLLSEQMVPVRDYYDKARNIKLNVHTATLTWSPSREEVVSSSTSKWNVYYTNCLFQRPFVQFARGLTTTSVSLRKLPPEATRLLVLAESDPGSSNSPRSKAVEQSRYGMADFVDLLDPSRVSFVTPEFLIEPSGNASNFLREEVVSSSETAQIAASCRAPDVSNVIPHVVVDTFESGTFRVQWPRAIQSGNCGGPSGFRLYLAKTVGASGADFEEVWPSSQHSDIHAGSLQKTSSKTSIVPDCALRGPASRSVEFKASSGANTNMFTHLLGKTFNAKIRSYSFKAAFDGQSAFTRDSETRALRFATLPARIEGVTVEGQTVSWMSLASWGGGSPGGFRLFRDDGRNSTSALTVSSISASAASDCGSTAVNCTLTSLTSGLVYRVRVAAYSDVGQGPYSGIFDVSGDS